MSDLLSTAKSTSTASSVLSSTPTSGAAAVANNSSPPEQLLGVYSTTVSGHQVAGTVEESNGIFIASVTHVPGGMATGNSEIAAEYNLATVIDELA
jgi:hypothetical protein